MDKPNAPCDLHLHSHYSDGDRSPDELVRRARSLGLSAVAITDHDTLHGQREALSAGERYGLEVITGIEFSIKEQGKSLHILGYLIDHANEELRNRAEYLGRERLERARMIVCLLSDEGVAVPFEEVVAEAGGGRIGRPHIARILLRNGAVNNIQEAFDRYIGFGGPCHVPKTVLPLEEIIRLIRESGGVAVWAHPGQSIRRKSLLDRLLTSGVVGVEVWHPNHAAEMQGEILSAAREHGLICTGGSDFHFEEAMHAAMGQVTAPYDSVVALKRAAAV